MNKWIWLGGVVLWVTGVAVGFTVLMGYQNAPGRPGEAPAHWPSVATLRPAEAQGTLVVFAHPRCACTRATLGELDRILRYVGDQVRTYVVFVQPDGYKAPWVEASVLWRQANKLPGVHVTRDAGGAIAQQFGARTSGQVLYYDARRRLRFAGGITGARGHEGDNRGRQALLAAVHASPHASTDTMRGSFVFGCGLQEGPVNAWKSFDFKGLSAAQPAS